MEQVLFKMEEVLFKELQSKIDNFRKKRLTVKVEFYYKERLSSELYSVC